MTRGALIGLAFVLAGVAGIGCGPETETSRSTPTPTGTTTVAPPFKVSAPVFDPNACCNDPKCNKDAFRKAGGVCPNDKAVRGRLLFEAPSTTGK